MNLNFYKTAGVAMTSVLMSVCSASASALVVDNSIDEAFAAWGMENPRPWHWTKGNGASPARAASTVTSPELQISPVKSYGSLNMPDGRQWVYSADVKMDDDNRGYAGVEIKIYDEKHQEKGTIAHTFELGENETFINYFAINANVTQKFFNIDDQYEVMLQVHAVTVDYTGHTYQKVFHLAPNQTEAFLTIDGHQTMLMDDHSDLYSPRQRMVFQREEIETVWDEDYMTYIPTGKRNTYFDVYAYANWDSTQAPRLIHTFTVDENFTSSVGEHAMPVLMNSVGGKMYYATWKYEKPYFNPDIPMTMEPEVMPDNNMIIYLWDESCFKNLAEGEEPTPLKTTVMPMETNPKYLYTFPILGGFRGPYDLSYGEFTSDDTPAYIISFENYEVSSDDYMLDIAVYDTDGNQIQIIGEEISGFKNLYDIEGQCEQYVLYNESYEGYYFMDYPSLEIVASIPFEKDGRVISTSLDRIPYQDSYLYVAAATMGEEGPDGTIVHPVGYFNPDGSEHHWDMVNLGPDVLMALPAIFTHWLDPYIFNTDDQMEYMFLVKLPGSSVLNEEHLWVINPEGRILLDFGPDEALGGEIRSATMLNLGTSDASLMSIFYHWDEEESGQYYTLNFNSLPLTLFEGGSGSFEDPYLVGSIGDVMQIAKFPSAYFKQVADIDFAGTHWTGHDDSFSGAYDGNGHVISNMVIDGNSMFGILEGGVIDPATGKASSLAKVKNMILDSPIINPTDFQAGFIAETCVYDGTNHPVIENVHIYNGKATGDFDGIFGGIAGGISTNSEIRLCSVTNACFDLPYATVGGLLGETSGTNAYVNACSFSGQINGNVAGGMIGESVTISLTDCHVDAEITGNEATGGIVGLLNQMSGYRGAFDRCYVEGKLHSIGAKEANVGGIAGNVVEGKNMAISNCMVALDEIAYDTTAKATAHRVAGHTSADNRRIDWDSDWWTDPQYEDQWDDPANYPYIEGEIDNGFINNYALSSLALNGDASLDDANSTEGKSIECTDANEDFFCRLGFGFGETADNPWLMNNERPCLYFEVQPKALSVSMASATMKIEEEMPLSFTLIGGDIDDVDIVNSNPEVIEITEKLTEGDCITLALRALSVGSTEIKAIAADKEATCKITVWMSGIIDIATDAETAIAFDGENIIANGAIDLYNASGIKVASAIDSLNVNGLAKGVYVAVSNGASIKLIVR